MNSLFQVICRIGIFMICAQAVIHFRPQETYEKYLKLLVSAMVLIQLFLPVGKILFHGDSEELTGKMQSFLEGLEEEISAAENRAYETDALLEQMTLEEIRRRMEESKAAPGEEEIPGTGREGSSTAETGREGDPAAENGREGDPAAENGREGTGTAENGSLDTGVLNHASGADGMVQIDRIQVGEIQVQIESYSQSSDRN